MVDEDNQNDEGPKMEWGDPKMNYLHILGEDHHCDLKVVL